MSTPTADSHAARSDERTQAGHGWLLICGVALCALGLFTGPGRGQDDPTDPAPPTVSQMPALSGFGTSDSNHRMIAVTGTDVTGSSVLFVIDTVNPHISVYQAAGGSKSTQGIKWVGARRIDLDLAVDGWNDKSEKTFKELERDFIDSELIPDNR